MSAASALLLTSAPIRKPFSEVSSIPRSGSALMSTRWAGVSICSFIRSTKLVPPAMNLAAGSAAEAQAAATPLGSFVTEGFHVRPPSATSRIAATILA